MDLEELRASPTISAWWDYQTELFRRSLPLRPKTIRGLLFCRGVCFYQGNRGASLVGRCSFNIKFFCRQYNFLDSIAEKMKITCQHRMECSSLLYSHKARFFLSRSLSTSAHFLLQKLQTLVGSSPPQSALHSAQQVASGEISSYPTNSLPIKVNALLMGRNVISW